jgi:hypothetical protein
MFGFCGRDRVEAKPEREFDLPSASRNWISSLENAMPRALFSVNVVPSETMEVTLRMASNRPHLGHTTGFSGI